MKKLIVIDGNSLLFRAYYATAYGDSSSIMRTKNGTPTNAIFAFSNMISKILSSFKGGESLFIGFDTDKETFRKAEFADYKANRKPAPEDLIPQFAISREFCKSLSIPYYEEHGIEADDICGTLAKEGSKEGYEVVIYTSDHDYLQLIDEHITVYLLKTGLSNMERCDAAFLKEKYGLTPSQVVDFKGLSGDTSDNYPGVPGVGEKTAMKLLNEYGSFPAIMEAAPNIKGKLGEKLISGKELGEQSYKLARIKTDASLPLHVADLSYPGYDFLSASTFANKYELKQFLSRLPVSLKKGSTISSSEMKSKKLTSFEGIDIPSKIGLALDIDFSSYHDEEPYGISISFDGVSYYEKIGDVKNDKTLINALESEVIEKDVYDGKASIYALNKMGVKLKGIKNDLLLAAYLLDSMSYSDPALVYSSFGVDIGGKKEVSLLDEGEEDGVTDKMAYYALALVDKATTSLKSVDAYALYSEVEMPLMEVLSKMEIEGFPLHKDKLDEYGDVFKEKKNALEKEIFSLAGESFNINSPKQIADILYNKMGLKGPKSGGTSVDDLKGLVEENPIVSKILDYRKYAKLIGTYIEGLAPHIKEDGKIHSYFNQAQTTTGRLSSSSPNLQNISARDEEGKLIRQAFYYDEPSMNLLSLDYGQIELRILAALSGCEEYIDVFSSGRDVHTETAKKIFHTEEVTPLERRKAKAVNFAIIYGTTVYGLAEQIGGTPQEASSIIKTFYSTYPEVGTFLNKVISEAESKGYVTTMFGRRRYLREVNDPNYARREAARRAALNAPVQGSAADLIKIAMVKIDKFLAEGKYKTKMVLQIHDELIFKVPDEELETMKEKLSYLMTHAVTLPVKLTVEAGVGKSWYEAKD